MSAGTPGTPNRDATRRNRPNRHDATRRNRPNRPNRRAETDRIGTTRPNRRDRNRPNRDPIGRPPPPFSVGRAVLDPRSLNFFALHCAFLQKSCKKGGCFFCPPLRGGREGKKSYFFHRKVILFHRKVREKSEKSQRKVREKSEKSHNNVIIMSYFSPPRGRGGARLRRHVFIRPPINCPAHHTPNTSSTLSTSFPSRNIGLPISFRRSMTYAIASRHAL